MTAMTSPGNPADARAFNPGKADRRDGEPDKITDTARDLAARAAPVIAAELETLLSFPVPVAVASISLGRGWGGGRRGAAEASAALCVASSEVPPDAIVLCLDTAAISLFTAALFGGDPDIRSSWPIAISRPSNWTWRR